MNLYRSRGYDERERLPQMQWVDTADGRFCNRHQVSFRRGEICQRCVDDPGDAIGGDEIDEPDHEIRARYAESRSRSKKLRRIADELYDMGGRDVLTGIKAEAEATKLERHASELYAQLVTKRDLAALIKKVRELDGGAAH